MSNILLKPYTRFERADFICDNGDMRFEETEKALFALEPNEIIVDGEVIINPDYEQEQLEKAKTLKLKENDDKANKALNHTFTIPVGEDRVPCEFIYNEKTERNLNSSAIGFLAGQFETKQWTDEQGTTVELTAEDVATVLLTFNDFANAIWAKWGDYYKEIEQAETLEELENIVIDYGEEEIKETVEELEATEENNYESIKLEEINNKSEED